MTAATPSCEPGFLETDERGLAPSSLDAYARDLVERARPIGPSDRMLDLGCGAGIVARVLRERLGAAASITGVDGDPTSIAKARVRAPGLAWVVSEPLALPFPDGSFELVFCHQTLQFARQLARDSAAVLGQVRRVLTPGGRFIAGGGFDGTTLRALLRAAGFVDVQVDPVTVVEGFRADVVSARRG